jgi:DNA gyrase subunit A
MSATTGLGLLDVAILEAIEAAGTLHDRPYLKTQRVLDVLHERTGIGPNQAYESLCDMARPYVAHLPLVDFHGNYGSPDFGPASPRYTECRLTELGEAALAAERGELGPLPIALTNGDLHQGGRRPPLDPTRVVEAIRAAASGASDESIIQMIGLPSFPSRCEVAGDLAAFASGRPCEVVASAVMVDGHARGRPTVTITALPPFTSASLIAESVQQAAAFHGRGRLGLQPSTDEAAPCPVSDVNDGSAGGQTHLIVTGRPEVSHADVRRFLDQVRTVHQHVQVELRRPIAALLRDCATSEDLGRRLDIIEQSIRS